MNMAELYKYLAAGVAIIGGLKLLSHIFTAWHNRVVAKLEEEKQQIQTKHFEALEAQRKAEERTDHALAARDEAVEIKDGAIAEKEIILKQARELRGRYDIAKKQRDDATAHRDQLVKELARSGGDSVGQLQQLRIELETQLAERQREIERLHEEAAGLVEEKVTLTGRLEEARARLADERKRIRDLLKQQGKIWLAKVEKDAPPFRPLKDRKTVIIAVLNLKGGVGKTTITANLAGYLGETGKRVLMIDLDHQRSLSQMLLTDDDMLRMRSEKKNIQSFLTSPERDGPLLLSKYIAVPGMKNCTLIPNHDPLNAEDDSQGLEDLEMRLLIEWILDRGETSDVRCLLREGLHNDTVFNSFDYVFLDCPPRLSTACVNALFAADFVLIPTQAESVAAQSVYHLLSRLQSLREPRAADNLHVLGVLGNLVKPIADISNLQSVPEAKILRELTASIMPETWIEPVALLKTLLTRQSQYFDASRELEEAYKLSLAISSTVVKRQFASLAKEIEELIGERRKRL